MSETSQGIWLGGAQKVSHCLCYAGPLAEKRQSEISGKCRRPNPIPWEKNSWERKNMRKRPATERRRECTDLG